MGIVNKQIKRNDSNNNSKKREATVNKVKHGKSMTHYV